MIKKMTMVQLQVTLFEILLSKTYETPYGRQLPFLNFLGYLSEFLVKEME